MGLLNLLFGGADPAPLQPERPRPVSATPAPQGVCAPCGGMLLAMADIPDPVFASGAMGPALGIKPAEGVVYAPVTGTITVCTHTLHAVGLHSDEGVDILIHVGVDTVNMKSAGFCGFVREGEHVQAGEALMTMDLARITEAGYSDVVITVITNAEKFDNVVTRSPAQVAAGEQIMDITA